MTPKQKAKELLRKVDETVCGDINKRNTKDIALLIVDEILSLFEQNKYDSRYGYYEAVKQELN